MENAMSLASHISLKDILDGTIDFDERIELRILAAQLGLRIRIEILGDLALLSIRIMGFKALRDIHHPGRPPCTPA